MDPDNVTEHWELVMKRTIRVATLGIILIAGLGACSATQHRTDVQNDSIDRVTVGTVQREITVGMPSADVAVILGSPNIVSTDAERREVWIYDKISTNVAYSRSNTGLAGLLIGASGGVGVAGSKQAGAASSSQRTLTIIIKFDEASRVRDFSYRTTSF